MRVEFLGNGNKEEIELRLQRVASAGRLSRTSGKAYEVYQKSGEFDYERFTKDIKKIAENGENLDKMNSDKYEPFTRNLNYAKRVIDMGHGSIAEHDYIMLAIDDVTPIVEHTLIGSRLASYTIKSRREVDFRNNGFYVPEFRDKAGNIHQKNEELQEKYVEHMKYLFDEYGHFVDSGMKLEDARYILPYCFNSNIFMGMDARSFVKLTKYFLHGKVSNISEIKKLGEEFLKIIDEQIPYMSDEVRKNTRNGEDTLEFIDSYTSVPNPKKEVDIHDKVKLTSYTQNADDIILASCLEQRYQISREKALNLLEQLQKEDSNFKEKLMKIIIKNEEHRELEQVSFNFDIPIILAVRTHLERHRMHSLLTPDFVPLWNLENYDIPIKLDPSHADRYHDAFRKNKEMRDYFENEGVNDNDLVYFYQAANKCNVLTSINGSSLAWISRMRCCNKAQWAINKIVKDMCREVKKVAPLYGEGLGATCDVFGYCNEGKESCGKVLSKNKKG